MKSRYLLLLAVLAVFGALAAGCQSLDTRTMQYRVQVWNEGSTQCGSVELIDSASGFRVGPLRYCLPTGELAPGDTVTAYAVADTVAAADTTR